MAVASASAETPFFSDTIVIQSFYEVLPAELLACSRLEPNDASRSTRFNWPRLGVEESSDLIPELASSVSRLLADKLADSGREGFMAIWRREGWVGVALYDKGFWNPDDADLDPSEWVPASREIDEVAVAGWQGELRVRGSGGGRIIVWQPVKDDSVEASARRNEIAWAEKEFAIALEGVAADLGPVSLRSSTMEFGSQFSNLPPSMVAILDNLPMAVAVFGLNGRSVYRNGAAETLLGEEAGIEGLDCDELISKAFVEDGCTLQSQDEEVIQVKIQREDRFFLPYVAPLRHESGDPYGAVLVLNDISRYRLAADLNSDFLGSVSHEIKGPLTSIRMAAMLLLDESIGNLNTNQSELAETVKEEVERLLRTMHNLLDVGRIQGGGYNLDKGVVRAHDILETSRSDMKRKAKEHGVELVVEKGGDAELVLKADQDRIVHVLNIIVSNAIKHAPRNSKVTLRARMDETDTVRFEVEDHGKGIAPQYHQQIFNRYVRLPDEKTSGLGLGLSIAREFVQAHGGAIGLDSEEGEGCCFFFELPKAVSSEG